MTNISDLYNRVKSLVMQFTYTKTELDNSLAGKSSSTHTHGNISNTGSVGSATGKIITTTTNGVLQASSNIDADLITDDSAYSNLGTSANATQSTINNAINTKMGNVIQILIGTGE